MAALHKDVEANAQMEAASTSLQCLFRSNKARRERRKKQQEFEEKEAEERQKDKAALQMQMLFRVSQVKSTFSSFFFSF